MADDRDLTTLSDEELDSIIKGANVTQAPPGKGAEVLRTNVAAVREKARRKAPPPTEAELIDPSAWNRFWAGAGARMAEPFQGAEEKLRLAFPGASPEARSSTLAQVAADRAERRNVRDQLEATTAGQLGGFVGQAAPFALAPPAPGAQALLAGGLGFLRGGADTPAGIGSELATSAFEGGLDAAGAAAAMKAFQLAGKGLNAQRGRYTPTGRTALELDDAARRLGVKSPTLGQLDPLAPPALRAHPELALQQADDLKRAMESSVQVPVPGKRRAMETQLVPGGRLKAGLDEAIAARRAQAREMYTAVDDYVAEKGLENVPASYTVSTLQSVNKQLTKSGKEPTGNNLVFNLLDHYDPDAFVWLKKAGSPKAARDAGMRMSEYHDARVAVGRALGSLERMQPANLTDDQIVAKKLLKDLKTALDNDVARWAKSNAGNEEAMALYNRAKDFYANVAAPALNNPLVRKIASRSRGFNSPEQMYEALINPTNRSVADRLLPTASRETRDMLNVLQNLPDVGKIAARGSVPKDAAEMSLGAMAMGAAGHPGLAAMEVAPGLRALSSLPATKRWYFGALPQSRALGPAAQYPAGALGTWARERMNLDQ